MKLFFVVCLFSILLLHGTNSQVSAQAMRVMSFNIRLDSPSDGENIWLNRRNNLVSMIRFHKADLIGLQEAQKHQLDYIMDQLPEYGRIGVGRDDGRDGGEFSAILYRKDRFNALLSSTFWCSPTPTVPGLGWDAAYIRIVTYAKFTDNLSGKEFFHFNTHLDNEGSVARTESAKLIMRTIDSLSNSLPVIVTGDFNSTPDSGAYKIITGTEKKYSRIQLYDTRLRSRTKHHGPKGTFTAFELTARPLDPIDFIFVTGNYTVLSHGTLSDSFDGYLPSDHYPVITEIIQ